MYICTIFIFICVFPFTYHTFQIAFILQSTIPSGQHGRPVNDSKRIKNGCFMEIRYFSCTNTSLQYRYGYITERFTGPFTWYRLRTVLIHFNFPFKYLFPKKTFDFTNQKVH